jgi:hypothetical protein
MTLTITAPALIGSPQPPPQRRQDARCATFLTLLDYRPLRGVIGALRGNKRLVGITSAGGQLLELVLKMGSSCLPHRGGCRQVGIAPREIVNKFHQGDINRCRVSCRVGRVCRVLCRDRFHRVGFTVASVWYLVGFGRVALGSFGLWHGYKPRPASFFSVHLSPPDACSHSVGGDPEGSGSCCDREHGPCRVSRVGLSCCRVCRVTHAGHCRTDPTYRLALWAMSLLPIQENRTMSRKKKLKIKHNPYATVGHKLKGLEGGVVTREPLPGGRVLVTIIDEEGRRTQHIEEAISDHN